MQQQRDLRVGAEGAVGHENIAPFQQRMQRQHLPRFVGEQRQRQTRSRGAVARRPHRHASHMPQPRHRDVAVQNLKHEQPDRHARRELAVPPAVTGLLGQPIDVDRQVRLELKVDVGDRRAKMTSHPWPPVGGVVEQHHHRRRLHFAQML